MDEPVSGFAALDPPPFGLRIGWLVPAGAGPSTIAETLQQRLAAQRQSASPYREAPVSFVGSLVAVCIQPSELPTRLTSIDDLKTVTIDKTTAVLAFSRNGWINNRIEELAHLEHIDLLPTSQALAAVADTGTLGNLIADLKGFLERLPQDPRGLPESAREHADQAELQRSIELSPSSLQAALSAFTAATSRDEEGENLETLVCLLWCLLRLAEHAKANGLYLICVRSQ
ncbi:hypothetical protein K2X89_07190 [Myxococcota bacterium]|nr:hypothetical protein [Myxococcota bacterium]